MDAYDICFSPDGRYIVVAVQSGDVLIWNVRTGLLVRRLTGHCDWVISVAFTPDGMGLFSGSYDQTVLFSDVSFLGDGKLKLDNGTGKEAPQRIFGKHTVHRLFLL